MEAAGASTLSSAGITEDELKPGDEIHVKCHALRDGSPRVPPGIHYNPRRCCERVGLGKTEIQG